MSHTFCTYVWHISFYFQVENDIENFLAVKMGFTKKIKLKPDVLPKFFNCQTDRALTHTPKPRSLVEKKRKLELIQSSIEDNEKKRSVATTSSSNPQESDDTELPLNDINLPHVDSEETCRDAGTQTIKDTKSVATQFSILKTFGSTKRINTIPIRKKDQATQFNATPAKPKEEIFPLIYSSSSSESDSENPESTTVDLNSTMSEFNLPPLSDEKENMMLRDRMIRMVNEKPLTFIGLPKESLHVCDKLSMVLKINLIFVFSCLVKIKLNLPFEVMSSLFGYSTSHLARCFNNHIRSIAKLLNSLVYWPSPELVKYNLPVPYRHRYKNVYCIIDCLEIEIQKPTDPQYQSATWSEYKKANTTKYLISCTPQGFINFISKGFGGRITDSKLIEKSGFLDHLKPGMEVMADRGFKNVDSLFVSKECKLVRPPSVYANVKPTKYEVKQTKRIASLRVIIENVIGRLRHFEFLAPHAAIPIKNIDHLDFAIEAACGLVNLQYPVRAPVLESPQPDTQK
uniref:DDE Tnp4 domain-containing protein n=1 Tax=Cacopsylla melanoneura TaxID=428564 RepID=A0A8D8T7W2_9HEMI